MTEIFKKENYPVILLFLFLLIWIILGINPKYRIVWINENILVVLSILLLILTYKKFRFSNLSYTLIFIYLVLHAIGSHFSYSEMPLFDIIKDKFDLSRNYYDRFVHFMVGFLFYFPVYEFISKKILIKSFWGYFITFLIITALKGIYEVVSFGAVLISQDEIVGTHFLGMQGDQWDAQKDMFMGILGSLLSWIVLSLKRKG